MSFRKNLLTSKLPPKTNNLGGTRRGLHSKYDFSPVSWKKYFTEKKDLSMNGNTFRVYLRGEAGPTLVLLHGGGFSALSWAILSSILTEMVECRVVAMDLRGHGDTFTTNDDDLSIQTMAKDVVDVIWSMCSSPEDGGGVILVGHSMGGAVAVHAGNSPPLAPLLLGLVVLDVVEGTALNALSAMQAILRGRPRSFTSIEGAIRWSVQSGQLKNIESAKVSMPGQLKNVKSNKPATWELEELAEGETPENPDNVGSAPPLSSPNYGVGPEPPLSAPITPVQTISEDEEANFKPPDELKGKYCWRIDLRATENHWPGWFQGLSKLFLSCPAQKLLLLASLDRLDTDLTVAQMQGKFEVHAFEQSRGRCGHVIQEDIPEAVAEVLAAFLVRNRFATPSTAFQGPMPCC